MCHIIKIRSADIQRQGRLAERRDDHYHYKGIRKSRGEDTSCILEERNNIAWFRMGIWKLRGTRGLDIGADVCCA